MCLKFKIKIFKLRMKKLSTVFLKQVCISDVFIYNSGNKCQCPAWIGNTSNLDIYGCHRKKSNFDNHIIKLRKCRWIFSSFSFISLILKLISTFFSSSGSADSSHSSAKHNSWHRYKLLKNNLNFSVFYSDVMLHDSSTI